MPLFTPKDFEKFIQSLNSVGESKKDSDSDKNDEQLSLF